MKVPDKFSPWQEALQSLEEHDNIKKHRLWPLFKKQHDVENLSNVIEDLRKVKDAVNGKHSEHGFSRTVERLELLHSAAGEALQYAPQTVGIVFTSLSVLFRCVTADLELCDVICQTIESVTHWIFVGEIYAKKYSRDVVPGPKLEQLEIQPQYGNTEGDPNGSAMTDIDPIAQEVRKNVPQLFAVVLQFCFEITKLELDSDGTASKEKSGLSLRRLILSQLGGKAQATMEHIKKGFLRKLKAFFGKKKDIQALVQEGTTKLDELSRNTGIDFEREAHDFLENIDGGIQKLKGLLQRIDKTMNNFGEDVQAVLRRLDRPHSQMLEWLLSWATLHVDQPMQKYLEMEDKICEGTCDWILQHDGYNDWARGSKRILWLSGKTGFGKSYMTSFVIKQLQSVPKIPEIDKNASSQQPLVIFFYCHTANDATQNCRKIMLHLIAQLFKMCDPGKRDGKVDIEYEIVKRSVDIIEQTREELKTAAVKNGIPKGSDATATMDTLWMNRLRATFLDLVRLLDKPVVVIIDGLDACHKQSIYQLRNTLESLSTSNGREQIQIWVSSRSELKCAEKNKPKCSTIDMDSITMQSPVSMFLESKLTELPHLGRTRRSNAVKKAIECSNSSFLRKSGVQLFGTQLNIIGAARVVQILDGPEARANPDETLENLENSVNQIHRQAFQGLSEVYRRWLKIALRWLVCGDGEISATLIADEIEQTYFRNIYQGPQDYPPVSEQSDGSAVDPTSDGAQQDNHEARVSIKELVEQASDMLQFQSNDKVELVHRTVREWVCKESQDIQKRAKGTQDCAQCWKRMCDGSPYEAAPKHGHLLLARHIMRTLNSEKFQNEHIFRPGIDEGEIHPAAARNCNGPGNGSGPCTGIQVDKDGSAPGEDAPTPSQPEQSGSDDHDGPLQAATSEQSHPSLSQSHAGVANELSIADGDAGDDSDAETVTSSDSSTPSEEDLQFSDCDTRSEETRYELKNWHYHIRQAELAWPEEERKTGPYAKLWDDLYSEVFKFMDNKAPAFRVWQKRFWPDQKKFDSRLHYAAAYGLVGVMKKFIAAKDDPLETNEYGHIPLHLACLGWADYTGLSFILDQTIEKGIEKDVDVLNDQTHFQQTPVMLLIRYGAPVKEVERLVRRGAKLNLQRGNGDSTLHDAVKSRSSEMCRYIVKEHVLDPKSSERRPSATRPTDSTLEMPASKRLLNPSVKNKAGETPLHILLKQDDAPLSIAKLLIFKQAQICAEDLKSQQPLFNAASSGNNAIAELLLDEGADVTDTEEKDGWTALHAAVSKGNIKLVQSLLEHGAKPDATDFKQRTPILLAADLGFKEILDVLLKLPQPPSRKLPDGHAQDIHDRNQSLEESDGDKELSWKRKLLAVPDKYGNTPLHKAAAKGHVGCTRLISQYGVDQGLANLHGSTPLHSAVKRGQHHCAGVLAEPGSVVNTLDKQHLTPLHYASKQGHGECTRILLDIAKADPNVTDEYGSTPLHYAAECRNQDCMRQLLAAGADPNIRDNNGFTPLHYVSENGDFESMNFLFEAKANFSLETKALDNIVETWEDYMEWTDATKLLVKLISRDYFSTKQKSRILNRALERKSAEVIRAIAPKMDGEQVDDHGWSLLALAVRWGDHELLSFIQLPESPQTASSWSKPEKDYGLDVSEDGLEIDFIQAYFWDPPSLRSDYPIMASQSRFYFEIEVLKCPAESAIGLGFCSQFFELSKFPGWSSEYRSWGYHSDDGQKFQYDSSPLGDAFGETWAEHDTVGAGVDFVERKIFFTKNGHLVGVAFKGENIQGKLFPVVGMDTSGTKIRANFGKDQKSRPFKFEWPVTEVP